MRKKANQNSDEMQKLKAESSTSLKSVLDKIV